jgi:predicted nucleic acid-binding protein
VNVIPDSSFFICFLDDLEGLLPISDRVRILTVITGNFTVMVVPEVEQELRFFRFPSQVRDQVRMVKIPAHGTRSDPSIELLRPLLGKGEHEVITCAHFHFLKGDGIFFFILDDGVARDLVKRILPSLTNYMKGTVGFIGHCAIRKVIGKNEAIQLLTVIGKSKFRVDRTTIITVITEIQNRCS